MKRRVTVEYAQASPGVRAKGEKFRHMPPDREFPASREAACAGAMADT